MDRAEQRRGTRGKENVKKSLLVTDHMTRTMRGHNVETRRNFTEWGV